jgi:AraC-like DNA-binding protein
MAHGAPKAWSGRARFGYGWTTYEGICGDAQPHRHLAAQLVIALKGEVRVAGERDTLLAPAVLIRAGALHAIFPRSEKRRVVYFQRDGGAVLPGWSPQSDDLCAPPTRLIEPLGAAGDFPGSVAGLLCDLPPPTLDDRRAMAMAQLSAVAPTYREVRNAARLADLSEARLRALAAQQLGFPLVQWRLWSMLQRTLAALRGVAPLAAAAADAGFSDQAHLNRTMRRFLGVTPRTVSALIADHPRA